MRMQRRQFRIGELAKKLNIERFVIRFWEKEFNIKTGRSNGGQRFYDQTDVDKFKLIKKLLHEQGFTIAGAKKQLEKPTKGNTKIIASQKTTFPSKVSDKDILSKPLMKQIKDLKKQLEKLRKML